MKEELLKVLSDVKQMKEHNCLAYSANYAMTVAKEGFEKEFEEAKREYMKIVKLIEHYCA